MALTGSHEDKSFPVVAAVLNIRRNIIAVAEAHSQNGLAKIVQLGESSEVEYRYIFRSQNSLDCSYVVVSLERANGEKITGPFIED